MTPDTYSTTGQLAKETNTPIRQIRDTADRIAARLGVPLPRFGLYRAIPASLIPEIKSALAAANAKVQA